MHDTMSHLMIYSKEQIFYNSKNCIFTMSVLLCLNLSTNYCRHSMTQCFVETITIMIITHGTLTNLGQRNQIQPRFHTVY